MDGPAHDLAIVPSRQGVPTLYHPMSVDLQPTPQHESELLRYRNQNRVQVRGAIARSVTADRRRVCFGLVLVGMVAAAMHWPGRALDDGPQLTHRVTRGELHVTVTEQGTLESSSNTEVKCKVRGYSTVTWVIPAGSVVEPGDELVRLDTKVIEEEFSLTKTNTFIAKATLEHIQSERSQGENCHRRL